MDTKSPISKTDEGKSAFAQRYESDAAFKQRIDGRRKVAQQSRDAASLREALARIAKR
jgi:hypothetical protein